MIRRYWPLIACVAVLAFAAPLAYSGLPPQAMGLVVIGDANTLSQQAGVDANGNLKVSVGAPQAASYTDSSGSITLGGTAQTLAALNTARKRIIIQNPCTATGQNIATAESLFLNFTTAATTAGGNSFELQPCGVFDSGVGPVSTELVSVIAATTSHKWVAKVQ